MKRIFFYLPVVTPWWFDHIIAPMLRALHGHAELHVMVAPLWRNTGIESAQLEPLADLDAIGWHIIDPDDGESFRRDGSACPGLVEQVLAIQPDLTIARSADVSTPVLFPGRVRYIMEGAAAPFVTDPRWVVLEERPFRHGFMPPFAESDLAPAIAALAPAWSAIERAAQSADQRNWRDRLGFAPSAPVLVVPLQYEHEENLFLDAAAYQSATDQIEDLLARLPAHVMLAVTDHPLNKAHVDRTALQALCAERSDRVLLLDDPRLAGGATGFLARHADAMLADQSKVWSLSAFWGRPVVNIGEAPMASWLHASAPYPNFTAPLPAPDPNAARAWFAWHLGHRMIDPASPQFDLARLTAAFDETPDAAMVAHNLSALLALQPLETA